VMVASACNVERYWTSDADDGFWNLYFTCLEELMMDVASLRE